MGNPLFQEAFTLCNLNSKSKCLLKRMDSGIRSSSDKYP